MFEKWLDNYVISKSAQHCYKFLELYIIRAQLIDELLNSLTFDTLYAFNKKKLFNNILNFLLYI